jgi:signal transduction histidine kinase
MVDRPVVLTALLDRWGLQYRITASVGLGLGLILALFGYVSFWSIGQATDAALRERRELAVLIAHQLDSIFAGVPEGALDSHMLAGVLDVAEPAETAERSGRLDVQIIDPGGAVIASSTPPRSPVAAGHARILADLIATRRPGVRTHEPTDGTSFPAHVVAYAPLRLTAGGGAWGVTVEQTEDVVFALPNRLRSRMLAAGVLALIAATALAWADTRRVVRPLRAVTAAAQRIAAGDLAVPLADTASFGRGDEVGRLTVALDTMRRRLVRSLEEIREWNQRLERRVRERTDALAAATAQRRQLLHKVIWAQEEERKRLARELHDDTVQTLSGLAMMLQAVEDGLPPSLLRERERLAWARDRAAHAAGEIRQLILDLRPSVLDDLGLVSAVHWYAGAHLERRGVRVSLTSPDVLPALPAAVQTCAFRVLQEAMANAARHARATSVHISLAVQSGALTACVEDDGVGFDPESTAGATAAAAPTSQRGGLGLLGMAERVALVDGSLQLESRPGGGTRVRFTIPLPAEFPPTEPAAAPPGPELQRVPA